MQRILVIGGSYFLGRVFNIIASQEDSIELHVVNRGKFPLKRPQIIEYVCDRHNTAQLETYLHGECFDAIVDFCAYEPGDIASLATLLLGRVKQYVYVSTSSVYDPAIPGVKTEDSPLIQDSADDPVSQYVGKKVQLEEELITACATAALPFTIIRPSFIYGPFNYAPRESWFIQKIATGEPVPVPFDATACFSMVFVTDLAKQLRACIGNERCFKAAFNSAAPEQIDYPRLMAELERCNGAPFATQNVSVAQVEQDRIALPFPLTEDVLVDGQTLAEVTGVAYTTFSNGMDKTFEAFRGVYESI